MSRLELILIGVLFISVVFNVVIFAYARAAITRLLSFSEELGDLQQMINAFAAHLKTVYELESFYGDDTLKNLLHHAISFNEQLDTFEYIYSLTESQEGELANDNEEQENTET